MKPVENDRHFPPEDYAVPDARNKRIIQLEAKLKESETRRLAAVALVVSLREDLARAIALNERMAKKAYAIARKRRVR